MRLLLACLLLSISFAIQAQTSVHSNLSTEISDNNKAYSIRIDGDRDGKAIHYNRTFSVAGMSEGKKEALRNRVLDSLGLGETPLPPVSPTSGIAPSLVKVTFVCPTCMGKTKLSINGSGFSAEREVVIEKNKPGFPFGLDMPPGEYQYTYWQNRVEQMRLSFTVKAGETHTVTVK